MHALAQLPTLIGVVAMCVVVRLLCGAIRRGSLPRQSLVGLRTHETMRSDRAWDAGHRAALPALMACVYLGYAVVALAVAAYLLFPESPAPLILSLGGLLAQGGLVVYAKGPADRAARGVQ
ncbi:SdpI family protein [Corynebacterium mastitidis]|uniref:SdpI family protein n=1 Tax=Corynebacterium mastitidis TaxID=161890 RepID=UPI00254A0066|nr:SdpI family protein [Corynebacterium mastitidis]MDK8449773.1 SdpI family protein [Corynebacterium mastitidis]